MSETEEYMRLAIKADRALAHLRAQVEALARSHEHTADIHAENAEYWRAQSTIAKPFATQVSERIAMAAVCRAHASDLRSLLREGETAVKETNRE